MLAVRLMEFEMVCFTALALWMLHSVWRSQRGDRRYGDIARLVVFGFSALIVYRDWRIIFLDDSDQAKVIMCVLGITLCLFTALAAKTYGRGAKL